MSPELIFDQGLGDLLVVRTGAHVLDNIALGSIEFGVEELGPRVIFVLGHESCGAVRAVVEEFEEFAGLERPFEGTHIRGIVERIEPLYRQMRAQYGAEVDRQELVGHIVRSHTRITCRQLASLPPVRRRVEAGQLIVVGGYYHLRTGTVDIIYSNGVTPSYNTSAGPPLGGS